MKSTTMAPLEAISKKIQQTSSTTQGEEVNRLWLKTLTLAEITRFKFGREGYSLTNKMIEQLARKKFASMVGIPIKSAPKRYLSELKRVYKDNHLAEDFADTLMKFGLNANDF